jgi:hypothetical protein
MVHYSATTGKNLRCVEREHDLSQQMELKV